MAPSWKGGEGQPSVGSNPTSSSKVVYLVVGQLKLCRVSAHHLFIWGCRIAAIAMVSKTIDESPPRFESQRPRHKQQKSTVKVTWRDHWPLSLSIKHYCLRSGKWLKLSRQINNGVPASCKRRNRRSAHFYLNNAPIILNGQQLIDSVVPS